MTDGPSPSLPRLAAHHRIRAPGWDAALALAEVRDAAAVPVLMAALDDPESLVRYHAARALLAAHGLPADTLDREHMMYRVMSDDNARRESGKRDILAAIAGRPLSAPRMG